MTGVSLKLVPTVNSYESLVRILGRRDLPGCYIFRNRSPVLGCYEGLIRDFFGVGVHAVVAHAHGDYRGVELAVGFYETGKADDFSVTQEVFPRCAYLLSYYRYVRLDS